MSKVILTVGNIGIKKNELNHHKCPVSFMDVVIEKVLVSNKTSFGKKTINTLLVTCINITKLSHCI